MSPELQQAVKERVDLGHTKEQIVSELQAAGYDDQTIEEVYAQTTGVATPVNSAELPSATSLFKEAWSLATSRLDLALLIAVPTLVLNVGAIMFTTGSATLTGWSILLLFGAVFILMPLLQFWLQLALVHSVMHGRHTALRDSCAWAKDNLWPWLWIATLMFVVVFGGFMLFIIPGVIVSFYVAFSVYAFMDEDVRGMAALQRSRELVTGNFWNILARAIVFSIFIISIIIVAAILGAIAAATLGLLGAGIEEYSLVVIDGLLTGFISVIGVAYSVGLYRALKAAPVTTIAPTKFYPFLGWFGGVLCLAFIGLAAYGVTAYIQEVGLENISATELMDDNMESDMGAELSPAEQAEFDAFMEEFGADLESY